MQFYIRSHRRTSILPLFFATPKYAIANENKKETGEQKILIKDLLIPSFEFLHAGKIAYLSHAIELIIRIVRTLGLNIRWNTSRITDDVNVMNCVTRLVLRGRERRFADESLGRRSVFHCHRLITPNHKSLSSDLSASEKTIFFFRAVPSAIMFDSALYRVITPASPRIIYVAVLARAAIFTIQSF